MNYRVSWSIDIEADSHWVAAEEAKRIMGEQALRTEHSGVSPPVFAVQGDDGVDVEIELP